MSFILPEYRAPDFSQARFQTVPDAILRPAPRDGVAPEGYHATTIFPEYFKIGGRWLLAEESRMDGGSGGIPQPESGRAGGGGAQRGRL